MQNIFGQGNKERDTGYPMYNEFLTSIAPLLKARMAQQQGNIDTQVDRQRSIDNQPTPTPMMPNPAFQAAMEANRPMDIRMGNPGGINPYQAAQLALSERRLADTEQKTDAGIDVAGRRVAIAEAAPEHAMDRTVKTGEDALARNTATNAAAMARTERQAQIGIKLQELKGNQTTEANKLKADLERELIGLRGEEARETKAAGGTPIVAKTLPPSQERIASLNRAQEAVNKNPEWQEFITIDGNGFIIKPSGDPVTDERIKAAVYGRGDIDLKAPKLEGTKVKSVPIKEEAPPKGMKPGGKWIVTKSGRRVYQE